MKDDEKEEAASDAIDILADSYKNDYIAANDISMSDAIRAENETLIVELAAAEKGKTAMELASQGKIAEVEQLVKEIEADAAKNVPKTELGRTLYEMEQKVSGEASVEEDEIDILLRALPVIKPINEQYLASYQKKQERIKELQDRKSNLSGWQNTFTYIAVSLQLFGLMFLLMKDLAKDTNERRERAVKELQKAEEETRAAEAEATEAKARARQANNDADEAEARAEQRIDEAEEKKEKI